MRWLRTLALLLACTLGAGAFAAGTSAACKNAPAGTAGCKKPAAKPAGKSTGKAARKTHAASSKKAGKGAKVVCESTRAAPEPGMPCPAAEAAAPAAPAGAGNACLMALRNSRIAQHLAGKLPFIIGRAPGADVLSSHARAGTMERSEIASFIAGYETCQGLEGPQGGASPERSALHEAYWRDARAALASLQAGRSSYGEAATALERIERDYHGRLAGLPATPAPAGALTAPAAPVPATDASAAQ